MDLKEATSRIAAQRELVDRIRAEVARVIVGQEKLVDRLLLALVTGGHILLEGVPGLAKTLSVNTLAKALGLDFRRISFTPDLLPADVVGTLVYSPKTGEFTPKKGPVFTNMLLADEINRAPAKVQSALLESMQERQVTIGGVYCDEKVGDYILDIVFKTRERSEMIQNGASPRATLALNLAARGNALMRGRAYATPQDVKEVVHDVLRHRILLTYEAEAEGVTSDAVIDRILSEVPVP